MEKELLTAEEIQKVRSHMMTAKTLPAGERELFMAQTVGDVYDVELPIGDVVTAVSDVRRVGVGEDVDYLVPRDVTKKILTLGPDCEVTEEDVTPDADQEMTFQDLVSPEYLICVKDWLKGKHNILKLHATEIQEAMNRQENYSIIQLLDAAAATAGNEFTLDSNKTEFDFAKFIEMRKAIRKYGRRLVLITGCNVTEDIDTMDFNQNTQRPHLVTDKVETWINIEDYQVEIDTVSTDVIDPDVAYLVAISDSMNRKPILFARRKTDSCEFYPDTERIDKERLVITSGLLNTTTTGSVKRRLKKGIMGYQEYGAVMLNPNVVAKFTRA